MYDLIIYIKFWVQAGSSLLNTQPISVTLPLDFAGNFAEFSHGQFDFCT
jgi:hypothetical protein